MIDCDQYAICKVLGHAWEPIAAPDKVSCRFCFMPGIVKDEHTFWKIVDQAHMGNRSVRVCVRKRSGQG